MLNTYAERIKYAMEKQDITSSELVRRTKLNKGAISSYLSGRYNPKQEAVYLLSKALNVSSVWLMGLTDDMNRKDSEIENDKIKNSESDTFNTVEDAMSYIIRMPVMSAYGGYDIDRMSDEEKIKFANKMAGMFKVIADEYKNK